MFRLRQRFQIEKFNVVEKGTLTTALKLLSKKFNNITIFCS